MMAQNSPSRIKVRCWFRVHREQDQSQWLVQGSPSRNRARCWFRVLQIGIELMLVQGSPSRIRAIDSDSGFSVQDYSYRFWFRVLRVGLELDAGSGFSEQGQSQILVQGSPCRIRARYWFRVLRVGLELDTGSGFSVKDQSWMLLQGLGMNFPTDETNSYLSNYRDLFFRFNTFLKFIIYASHFVDMFLNVQE